LTHPFVVEQDSPLSLEGETERVLIHNGTICSSDVNLILAAADIKEPAGLMSDSRAIALILAKHGSPNFLKKIKGNFMFVDSTKEKGKFLLIGDTFSEEDGIFYSNLSWKFCYSSSSNYQGSFAGEYDDWQSRTNQMGDWNNQRTSVNNSNESVSVPVKTVTTEEIENALKKKNQDNALNDTLEKEAKIKKKREAEIKHKYEKFLKRASLLNGITGEEVREITGYEIIPCKDCGRALTQERIRLMRGCGHKDTISMRCLPCSEKSRTSYYSALTQNATPNLLGMPTDIRHVCC